MPLIPQQNIVVVSGPYSPKRGQDLVEAAAEMLQASLENYPPCRIVSISSNGTGHMYSLTCLLYTSDAADE